MNRLSINTKKDVLFVEDYDNNTDGKFVKEYLMPYFKDLFRDLAIRCLTPTAIQEKKLDKVTFIEYCALPGIIGDRLFKMFDTNNDGLISEPSFVNNLVKIFISDLDQKMRLTFNMYDFNADGFISKEDVRLVLSYIPIQCGDNEHEKNLDEQLLHLDFSSQIRKNRNQKEGLYQQEDGKSLNYNDRVMDQQEIKGFLSKVFKGSQELSFYEYVSFNKTVSSEMFLSLMAVLHDRLPCQQNFFRLKKIFRTKINSIGVSVRKSQSPTRAIASPTMLKNRAGLSQFNSGLRDKRDPQTPTISNKKKLLDSPCGKYSNGSNYSSQVASQYDDSEEDKYDQLEDLKQSKGLPMSKFRKQEQNSNDENLTIPLGSISTQTSFMKIRNSRGIVDSPSNGMKNAVRLNMSQKNSSLIKEESKLPGINSPKSQFNKSSVSKSKFSRKNVTKEDSCFTSGIVSINNSSQKVSSQKGNNSPGDDEQQAVIEYYGCQLENKANTVFKEGKCYLKTKSETFKSHWVVIMGNELYCYRKQDDVQHRVMHCLVGTFFKELPEDKTSGQSYWAVKIILPPMKSRILYFESKEQQSEWAEVVKEAQGYSNIFDFYTVDKTLGSGQFGEVKLATHKKTSQQVAIKIIKKKNMKPIEAYQQRKEIEILKMCQHPNVIKLIDLFENSECYYIVLEYMAGKDLFEYLKVRNFKVPEDRAKELSFQLAKALQYLHSYGIVHRDLKLENIMMSDNTSQSVPKLVDFGLAKIIGPTEKSDEPFGTLGYVAPEVLKKDPYSFSCDLWSLGCIIYALLSGSLPFDHEDQQETMRLTLTAPLVFDLPIWNDHSDKCKDLITKLLIKDPAQRISLEKTLAHPWFKELQQK